MIARVKEDGSVEKFPKPVIHGQPDGYTSHFRDPKVFKKDDQLYAIIEPKIIMNKGGYYYIKVMMLLTGHFLVKFKRI